MDPVKQTIKSLSKELEIKDKEMSEILGYKSLNEYQNSLILDERWPKQIKYRAANFIGISLGLRGLLGSYENVKTWLITEKDFNRFWENLGTHNL